MEDNVELRVSEVAQAVGVSPRTVKEWIKPQREGRRKLPAYKPLGSNRIGYRIAAGDLRAFLDQLPAEDGGHTRLKFEAWAATKGGKQA